MRLLENRAIRRSLCRRSVSVVLIGAYAVTAAGIPLPIGGPLHQGGESYPCVEHACGCASAEQCWRSCCCHTLAERFEWARENQVRPPEYAIAVARAAGIDLAWLHDPSAPGSAGGLKCECIEQCVAQVIPPTEPGADGHQRLGQIPSCCRSHAACCQGAHPKMKHAERIVGWRVLDCHGQSSFWLAAVPPLVSFRVELGDQRLQTARLGPVDSESATGISTVPTPPPPECA